MNPIVERNLAAEAEHRERVNFRYPFRIVCVYQDEENNDFPIIHEVRNYCNHNNLIFLARQYNADKYAEDVSVNRLPAFHIYYKKDIQETHYYNSDPVHKIQVLVWAYQDEMRDRERARIRRQERWTAFTEGVSSLFSLDHFKKKPALDIDQCLSHTRTTQ